jgi:hypothetical protein
MARAGRLGQRLRAVEARHRARRERVAAAPPFDPARLTAAELAELEPLKRRVAWRNGRPDFAALSDDEFERLARLYFKGTGGA